MAKRRLQILLAVGAVLLALCIVVGSGFISFRNSLGSYYTVKLRDGHDEVTYRLGNPFQVLGPPDADSPQHTQPAYLTDPSADPGKGLPAGKSRNDFADWKYPLEATAPNGPYVSVHFGETGGVDLIRCIDTDANRYNTCDPIANINIGNSEEEMVQRLGVPGRSRILGVTKEVRYPNLGIQMYLTHGRVYGLALGPRNSDFLLLVSYLRILTRQGWI